MAEKVTQSEQGGKQVMYTVCQEFLRTMDLVLDGEATKEEEQFFFKHIKSSQDCFKEYEDTKGFRKFFKETCTCKQIARTKAEKIKNLILNLSH